MAVTFRDSASIERSAGFSNVGDPAAPSVVVASTPAFVWEELLKVQTTEGEVFQATCQALLPPGTDVKRRDILVARSRRFEVLTVFPGRHLTGGAVKFVHVTLREATF
jgi:hypothetical protein